MFKKITALFLSVCIIFACNVNVRAISASSAIVYDPLTKTIIYQSNAFEEMSMASTTKLMTSLLASEYILQNSDETVIISDEMCMVEGSSMGLLTGDEVKLSSLIIGMLLPSGNDAANAVALYIAGSFENFAVLMNEKAQSLGMDNSNFVTPSGLDAENHYSTVYDMALLMAECLTNEYLAYVLSSQSLAVEYYSILKEEIIKVSYTNHNKLLSYYDYCTGGKTGYTMQSGRCLVSCASQNTYELICVTFNAPDDWNDHMSLYDNAYELIEYANFNALQIDIPYAEGGNLTVEIDEEQIYSLDSNSIERVIFLPRFLYGSSLVANETIGYVRYYNDGILILENEIIY